MKRFSSLLLASAAGFVAVAGASAADLGAKKPAAATYVKECPAQGAGFFVVPGTTSCLKILGRVRADYVFNDARLKTADKTTFRARGYFGYDHRTTSELGLIRTYLRAFITRDNAGAAGTTLDLAFIQIGGFTFGRMGTAFNHGFNHALDNSAIGGQTDVNEHNGVAYTHSFGGGFKATVELLSNSERRLGLSGGTYAGQTVPDAVLALDYNQSWGDIKLAGAVHHIGARTTATVAAPAVVSKSATGFAGVLAARFNLPMLNKGSNIWATVSGARGAASYAGFVGSTAGGNAASTGNTAVTYNDAVVINNKLKLSTAYAVAGGVQVYVLPTVWVGLGGSYGVFNPSGANNTIKGYTGRATAAWVPVAGLTLASEVGYNVLSAKATAVTVGNGGGKSSVYGRLRVQRDF